mmetsp:Transcript_23385/g.73225  ORF Transcript_23385/g.73225 Transcript_23385/m.73225 type:complete len:319 (-) Transcript_23385:407-1363(-)
MVKRIRNIYIGTATSSRGPREHRPHLKRAEHVVGPADPRSVLFIVRARVAGGCELWGGREHTPPEPHRVPLHRVAHHVHVHPLRLEVPPAALLARLHPGVHPPLDVTLQPPPEVLAKRRPPREHHIPVERPAGVDGAALDALVHHVRQRGREVARVDLGLKEHLGCQETLVRHVNLVGLPRAGAHPVDALHVLAGIGVMLAVLFYDVAACVAVLLLDPPRHVHRVLRGHGLPPLAHQRLCEVGEVPPCDRDALDAAADHVPIRNGDHVRHPVPRVHHSTGEAPVHSFGGCHGGGKREHRLHRDIEPAHVERLEHHLGR